MTLLDWKWKLAAVVSSVLSVATSTCLISAEIRLHTAHVQTRKLIQELDDDLVKLTSSNNYVAQCKAELASQNESMTKAAAQAQDQIARSQAAYDSLLNSRQKTTELSAKITNAPLSGTVCNQMLDVDNMVKGLAE